MAAAAPFHTAVLTLLSSSLCHHHPLWLGHTPAYPALRLGSPERTGHCPGGDDGGKRGAEEVGGYSGLHSPLSPGLTHGPRLTFTVFLPPQQSWAHTTRSLQAHSSSRASQTRLPSSEEPGPLHPCKLASSQLPDKLRPLQQVFWFLPLLSRDGATWGKKALSNSPALHYINAPWPCGGSTPSTRLTSFLWKKGSMDTGIISAMLFGQTGAQNGHWPIS